MLFSASDAETEIFTRIQKELKRAVVDRKHAWRLFTLATLNNDAPDPKNGCFEGYYY